MNIADRIHSMTVVFRFTLPVSHRSSSEVA
ncbi:hypothetical protein FHT02_003339 [Sphingomonas xinjiangensis]|uniref:Uncharacterized protein n=1 Tax=Sphingomonas xinjiangensis TaxID=643568 RepID=A0A840YRP7_9SPHN|nr:hypothetical protein [Sphingomonas xinjiangensis]